MDAVKKTIILLLSLYSLSGFSLNNPGVSRNFWYPNYHGKRLDYCSVQGKCGEFVADQYCKLLGYQKATQVIKDYNVGYTNLIRSRAECQGWQCYGFKLIACIGNINKRPIPDYDYRLHKYTHPRMNHYRIAWCYKEHSGCGHRAASSFCRRMGYRIAKSFKKELNVPATQSLGEQKLCFGSECNGFASVTCYR
jgi:hypothetical protein